MAVQIDEDKITLLIEKTAKKAAKAKEDFQDCVTLLNQLRGISKNAKGDLPVSSLTKKELKPELRDHIYSECMEAAQRLNLV